MKNIRIAHISDPHVTAPGTFPPPEFKKVVRWVDLLKHRFSNEIFATVLNDLKNQSIDHTCFTGDLTNNGLLEEFKVAREMIKEYVGDKKEEEVFSWVPGNHDLGTQSDFDTFTMGKLFPGIPTPTVDGFPFIKIMRASNLMLIHLSTAIPQPLLMDFGEACKQVEVVEGELKKLEKTETNFDKFFKIILMHHAPVSRLGKNVIEKKYNMPSKDKERVQELCRVWKIDLVLNGHIHVYDKTVLDCGTVVLDSGSCSRKELIKTATHSILEIDPWKKKIVSITRRGFDSSTNKIVTK